MSLVTVCFLMIVDRPMTTITLYPFFTISHQFHHNSCYIYICSSLYALLVPPSITDHNSHHICSSLYHDMVRPHHNNRNINNFCSATIVASISSKLNLSDVVHTLPSHRSIHPLYVIHVIHYNCRCYIMSFICLAPIRFLICLNWGLYRKEKLISYI